MIKKILTSFSFAALTLVGVVGCKKDAMAPQSGNPTLNPPTSANRISSADYGGIHNEMLDYFYTEFSNDGSFPDYLNPENYRDALSSKLSLYTDAYIAENYPDLYASDMYSDIVTEIRTNPMSMADLEDADVSEEFINFMHDLKDVIDNHSASSSFNSYVNDIEDEYDDILTDDAELMAMEAGCATAIGSNEYWDENTDEWNSLFADPGSAGKSANKTTAASTNDILWADAGGAIGGTWRGARAGLLLGPGGGVAGGMIGFLAGAAVASGSEYGWGKVRDWLGFP